MAYFRFNSGATAEVDDDELVDLIKAGAGTEVDAPNPMPAGAEHVTLEHPDTVIKGKDRSLQGRIARMASTPITDENMPSTEYGYPFAPNSPNILQRAYQGGKNALSVPLAGLEGLGMSALNVVTNPLLGRDDPTSPVENARIAYAGRNEGLRSFGNDPINAGLMAANFVPGLDFATAPLTVSRLGKYGNLAATIGRDMAMGAGTGAAEAYLSPDSHITPEEGAFGGAVLSGVGAGVGAGLRAWGKHAIPGIGSKYNLKVPEESKELYRQNADAVLSKGFFPKGREGFLRLAEGIQNKAGKDYEAGMTALETARPDLRFKMSDWENRARQRLVDDLGNFHEPGLELADTPEGFRVPDLASGILESKLGTIKATKLKQTPRAWAFKDAAEHWDPDMIREENARIAGELTPQEFGLARTGTTDPVVFQNQDAELARIKRKAGHALHGSANEMLMEHPEYAAAMGETVPTNQIFRRGSAPQRYKLGATIEDITNSPGAIGLSNRLHLGVFNPAVDPWLWASGAYKLGQAVDHAGVVPVGSALLNGYRRLTGGIPVRERDDQAP